MSQATNEAHRIKVSVIIPVYNGGEYLHPCLDSLVAQDMPASDFEVVAVDDGSTDGSGEVLDRYAAEHANFHAIHQENSGWPGQPRNVGTDASSGEYVFYVDADDYLGPEALRRMYEFAREHESDVVLVKLILVRKVDGRWLARPASRMWANTQIDADPRLIFKTFRPMKLIRRSLLRSHGLRFPEGKVRLEDGIFVSGAYLAATRVSLLADYDYYFLRQRNPIEHISKQAVPPEGYIESVSLIMDKIHELDDEEVVGEVLLGVYRRKALKFFVPDRFLRYQPQKREQFVTAVQRLAEKHIPIALEERLPASLRLRSHVARGGDVEMMTALAEAQRANALRATLRDGRVLLELPGANSPLELTANVELVGRLENLETGRDAFVIRAHAMLRDLRSDPFNVELFLRERSTRREIVLSTHQCGETHDGWHRIAAQVRRKMLANHGKGIWDVNLRCRLRGKVDEARLAVSDTAGASPSMGPEFALEGLEIQASPYVTARNNLSIEVCDRARRTRTLPTVRRVVRRAGRGRWLSPRRLVIRAVRACGLELLRVRGTVLLSRRDAAKIRKVAPGAAIVGRKRGVDIVDVSPGTVLVRDRRVARRHRLDQDKGLYRHLAVEHVAGILSAYRVNCVIEVGAYRGHFARQLRRAGYRGHIVSFEPVPGLASKLARMTDEDDLWTVRPFALGRKDDVRDLNVVPGPMSSLLSANELGKKRYPVLEEPEHHAVHVRRLEDVLDDVTADVPEPRRLYLKLDTQGLDLDVFAGLGQRVRDFVAIQSMLALVPIYEGMATLDQGLRVYRADGFEISAMYPATRDQETSRVLMYDCVLVRASSLEAQVSGTLQGVHQPSGPS